MKRGMLKKYRCGISPCKGKIKVLGISSGKRREWECAREDPVSLKYLKTVLEEARKKGAETKIIDLHDLKIEACKECYSTNPAQCRFNEKTNQCDCYAFKEDTMFLDNGTFLPIEKAYDHLNKKEFFELYHNEGSLAKKDDMWKVYKAMREADAIIFATSTQFYSRPALLQTMFSRLCALDGGVEELWGDGKNLKNSIAYSKRKDAKYKQRLYGKWCAFINCSKEGDSATPDLLKACTMLGMKIIPLGVAYRVNWYNDPTHRSDTKDSLRDEYTLGLLKHMGRAIVQLAKQTPRKYGLQSGTV